MAASNMVLELKDIKGDSLKTDHSKQIDVLSFQWGVSNIGDTQNQTQGVAGEVSVNNLSITKNVDLATPDLLRACCVGEVIDDGTLYVRRITKDGAAPYLRISMKNVIIADYSTGGSNGGSDPLLETISLNFSFVEVGYTPMPGAKKKAESIMSYDINTEQIT